MDNLKLSQYEFGAIAESGAVKGLNGKGYDAMLDLYNHLRIYGKEDENDIGLHAFAYLFRRLGPPKGGCNPQKLAYYRIPCNDKIFLAITLGTEIEIEVHAEKELAISYLDWFFAPIKTWFDNCTDWCIENKQQVIYDQSYALMDAEKQEKFAPYLEADLKRWELTLPQERQDNLNNLRAKGTSIYTVTDKNDFFAWKAVESEQFRNEYKEIEAFPLPSGDFETIYCWHKNLHETTLVPFVRDMYKVVNDTIRELLKPVLIDGVYCNIFGSVEIVGDETTAKEADGRKWKHAGNGFIEYDLHDYANWNDLCLMARSKGNGDIQLGFQKFFAPQKNADLLINRKNRKVKK